MHPSLRVIASTLALAATLAVGIATAPAASAATTGSISGEVSTSNGGAPLDNVCVTTTDSTTSYSATTNAAGDYQISNLPAGDYLVLFDPTCGQTILSSYSIAFWPNADELTEADQVAVGSGDVTINGTLFPSSSMSGTVTNTSSGDLAGVCVYLYSEDGYLFPASTTSSASGTYTIDGLPDGVYHVKFDPTCIGTVASPYAIQFYSDAPDYGAATTVGWESPTTKTAVNASLALGSTISGVVTAPGASNSAGICVEAWATTGYYENLAGTAVDGSYQIGNLPADTYKIEFDPTCDALQTTDYAISWYSGAPNPASAATETLGTDQALPAINGTLGLAVAVLSISSASLPAGTQSTSYSETLQESGGSGPFEWAASGLPAGLAINASTGVISGTPTASGTFTVSITVSDASTPPVSTTTSLSLTVAQATVPSVTTTTVAPVTKTVCTIKTKTVAVHTVKIVKGKRVVVVTHKKVRVYKTVTVKKVKKVHGKSVVVITHKTEPVKTCKVVTIT